MLVTFLRRFVDVRAREASALLVSFAYFFCLLCAYYILRPVREEMGIVGGVERIPWLFTATFLVTLAVVPLYAAIVARMPRRRFVPLVHRFFALHLVGFFAALALGAELSAVARVFFVWANVFNMFVVSVFWSFMADLWRRDQGVRLFGFIAAGGSAGALVGPLITERLVGVLGAHRLLLVSAILLEGAVFCVGRLVRLAPGLREVDEASARVAEDAPNARVTKDAPDAPGPAAASDAKLGGGPLEGIVAVARSPYLLAIAAQAALLALTATVLYLQQLDVVRAQIPSSAARTALFARMELVVNALTIVTQALFTGRIMRRFGIAVALSVVPAISIAGFLGLAALPIVPVIVAFQGLRRSAQYAVERPARETLFTAVTPAEKYKAKSFLDTVVYRGADAASSWAYAALAPLVSARGLALAMIPLALGWIALNVRLSRGLFSRAASARPPLTTARPSPAIAVAVDATSSFSNPAPPTNEREGR